MSESTEGFAAYLTGGMSCHGQAESGLISRVHCDSIFTATGVYLPIHSGLGSLVTGARCARYPRVAVAGEHYRDDRSRTGMDTLRGEGINRGRIVKLRAVAPLTSHYPPVYTFFAPSPQFNRSIQAARVFACLYVSNGSGDSLVISAKSIQGYRTSCLRSWCERKQSLYVFSPATVGLPDSLCMADRSTSSTSVPSSRQTQSSFSTPMARPTLVYTRCSSITLRCVWIIYGTGRPANFALA